MPSALAFIGGGLLEGVGKGLAEQGRETGKAKYERAMADLEQKNRLELEGVKQEGRHGLLDAGNKAALERLGLNIESRETLASEATTSREKIASEATASREKIAAIVAGKATDTTAAEDRIIKRHVQMDKNSIETVDHEAAAVELEDRGFKEAAAAQRRKGKGIAELDNRRIAEAQADAEVDEKAHPLVPDSVDFKEDGGSRIRFRARRVREIMAELEAKPAETKPATTKPAATDGEPYTGDTQPPGFPDAKRAKDGFWYVKREGKILRVQNSDANRAPSGGRLRRGK